MGTELFVSETMGMELFASGETMGTEPARW